MQCGIEETGFETTQTWVGIMTSRLTSGLVLGKWLNLPVPWFSYLQNEVTVLSNPTQGLAYHRHSVNICWLTFPLFVSFIVFFLAFPLFHYFLWFYLRFIKIPSAIMGHLGRYEYWIFIGIIEWLRIFSCDNRTTVTFFLMFLKKRYILKYLYDV